jgi:predicted DsbA family dithiol-disulfide isomerase
MTSKQAQKAIKILTQYERLANKYGLRLSDDKIQELNTLRDHGLIKVSNLPAKLRNEFPGEFSDMNLNEIRAYEG